MINLNKNMAKTKTSLRENQLVEIGSGDIHVINDDLSGPTIMDYITESKMEMEEKLEDKVNKTKNNIDSKLLKNKTVNVKYWYDGIPDKAHPDYSKIISRIPHYAHDGDIGMDIIATGVEYNVENDAYIYHTGFYSESDKGGGCFILPRSSNSKTEAYLPNSAGLVDTMTYRGEFLVVYKNRTSIDQLITNALFYEWLTTPWYKKIFTNYEKWSMQNCPRISSNVISKMKDLAPYEVGDKIAQLVWFKFPTVNMTRVKSKDKLSKTTRGEGGFGSTGK